MDESVLRTILRQELDQKLSGLEQRVDQKLSSLERRVDEKLGVLKKDFDEKFEALEARLDDKLHQRDLRLNADFERKLTDFEQRIAENGRMQFRQLADLYRGLVDKLEHLEKHVGDRLDATRGSIESLRSALERQDFRSDELGRRLTALETRPQL